jgi:Domain of unknown function (DUF4190)
MQRREGAMTYPQDPQPEQQPYQQQYQQQPYQQQPYYQQPYYQQYGPPPDHPQATTALILGIIGMVLCQLLGPFAFVIGRKALREIDASGGTLGGRGNAQVGYVLGIVSMVLLAVYAVIAVVYVIIFAVAVSSTST